MLNLERSENISSNKKMDRQGLREISLTEEGVEEEEEEEEEEDPLPVYNPHGDSEDERVRDDVSHQDTDTDTGPYYETITQPEGALIHSVSQQ